MIHVLFVLVTVVQVAHLSPRLDDYKHAPLALSLNVSRVLKPSGAYAKGSVVSVISRMIPVIVPTVVSGVVLSILYSVCQRKYYYGHILLNLQWTKSNEFMKYAGIPNWITSLPLHESNMIKIGNKLFCKPSTQATMGYATLVPNATKAGRAVQPGGATAAATPTPNLEDNMTTISVYALLPVVLYNYHRLVPKALRPLVEGTIHKNIFTPAQSTRLSGQEYVHNRGECVS
ncbi:hypothetical protein AC1031_016506 [Aphanomyces cochlioides]|nr:hypothetical protein AC1031_016506 [Aphanomyces cochlioides]